MRNYKIILFALLIFVLLVGCSKPKEEEPVTSDKAENESSSIEATLDDAHIVVSNGQLEGDKILLQLELKVKNLTESTMSLIPLSHMSLYDGDDQIDPVSAINSSIGLRAESTDKISAGKQKKMHVLFEVEKDKTYELAITPGYSYGDEDREELLMDLDISAYMDELDRLEEAETALQAYIENIYLNKDSEDYKKLVAADQEAEEKTALQNFEKNLKFWLMQDSINKDEVKELYKQYKKALAEKTTIDIKLNDYYNDLAILKLDYETIPYDNLYSLFNEQREKFRENNDLKYDRKAEAEYILDNFEKLLDEVETEQSSRTLEVFMKKTDGKWDVDDGGIGTKKRIMKIFTEGYVS